MVATPHECWPGESWESSSESRKNHGSQCWSSTLTGNWPTLGIQHQFSSSARFSRNGIPFGMLETAYLLDKPKWVNLTGEWLSNQTGITQQNPTGLPSFSPDSHNDKPWIHTILRVPFLGQTQRKTAINLFLTIHQPYINHILTIHLNHFKSTYISHMLSWIKTSLFAPSSS